MVTNDDLDKILAQALEETKRDDEKVNLAEIGRRTGVSRARLRKWQNDGYRILDDRRGRKVGSEKLAAYTEYSRASAPLVSTSAPPNLKLSTT